MLRVMHYSEIIECAPVFDSFWKRHRERCDMHEDAIKRIITTYCCIKNLIEKPSEQYYN